MEQPYFFIALIIMFMLGVFFKWVWDISYSRGEPPKYDEQDLLREAQMMQDAKRSDIDD